MLPLTFLLIAALAPAGLIAPPSAGAAGPARWQSPAPGFTVARHFSFDRRSPYRAGHRRVADLVTAPGQAVRTPCSGEVVFAGRLPTGLGVTVACGRHVATLTGLGSVATRRGSRVQAGQPAGSVGGSGRFRLGARLAGSRHGYLDPLALIESSRRPAPLAPAARRVRRVRPEPRVTARADGGAAPIVLLGAAWLGLGLAGSAIGIGIALRGAGRARAPAATARHAGR